MERTTTIPQHIATHTTLRPMLLIPAVINGMIGSCPGYIHRQTTSTGRKGPSPENIRHQSTSTGTIPYLPMKTFSLQLEHCLLNPVVNGDITLRSRETNRNLKRKMSTSTRCQKLKKKTVRPKASDFDDIGKELVLASANRYRALLASQDAFPNVSKELKLVKKSWKLANADSGMKSLTLTPSIVKIVSNSFLYAYELLHYMYF